MAYCILQIRIIGNQVKNLSSPAAVMISKPEMPLGNREGRASDDVRAGRPAIALCCILHRGLESAFKMGILECFV